MNTDSPIVIVQVDKQIVFLILLSWFDDIEALTDNVNDDEGEPLLQPLRLMKQPFMVAFREDFADIRKSLLFDDESQKGPFVMWRADDNTGPFKSTDVNIDDDETLPPDAVKALEFILADVHIH